MSVVCAKCGKTIMFKWQPHLCFAKQVDQGSSDSFNPIVYAESGDSGGDTGSDSGADFGGGESGGGGDSGDF